MAVQMSQEQLVALLQAVQGGGQGGGGGRGRRMEIKDFQRISKFAGGPTGESQWRAWSTDIKMVLNSVFPSLVKVLNLTEGANNGKEITGQKAEHALVEEELEQEFVGLTARSLELYEVLHLLTEGEAKLLIMTSSGGDGIRAWQLLALQYARPTLARSLRQLREVLNPKQLMASGLIAGIAAWEAKLHEVERGGEKLSEVIKLAGLTELCPFEVREMVFQNLGIDGDYKTMKEKIVSWLSNKVAMSDGPTPMDLGNVDDKPKEAEWEEGGEYSVDAIGNMTCHGCGGWGHMKRDCPSQQKAKGKGKAGKGKGHDSKGKGKGHDSKGKGKGQETEWSNWGKGQSFGGQCYNCGEWGHRKTDCPSKVAASVDQGAEEEEEATQSLDSVWMIGQVETVKAEVDQVENAWTEAARRKTRKSAIFFDKEPKFVGSVGGVRHLTREAQIEFNEADVRKPLASARLVAKAGNGIWLEENGGYIQNLATGEKMSVRVVNDVYVFDVELDDKTKDVITLDSGAGCSVWPRGRHSGTSKMSPGGGCKMIAANGSPIKHYGQRRVSFKGLQAEKAIFGRRM